MDGWIRDARFAVRGALRRPGFTVLVVATLALGIGANTAVFSVVHALLLESLPYEKADRLVVADQLQPTGHRAAVSMPNYQDWRGRSTAFDAVAMERSQLYRVEGDQGAEILEGRAVLDDYFQMLGVDPVLGVLPTPAELGPGAEPIVVLTHGLWSRRFGGVEDAIGASLPIGGRPYRIVAVMPPEFTLAAEVALYTPLGLAADDPAWHDRSTSFGGGMVARMRPGVTLDEARADLARVTRELRTEFGDQVAGAAVFSMRAWYVGDVREPLLFLMAGVGLVLLVACANVTSLLLGRSEERRADLALRAALGAGRGQMLRQLLMETLVYALAGGVAGLVLARLALTGLVGTVRTTLPAGFVERVALNLPVVLVALAAALGVTLLFGLAPAVSASRGLRAQALRPSLGGGPAGVRLRGLLVAGEVALSMVLLVCTGLLVRSVAHLHTVDTGFSAEGVLTQRISVPGDRYPERETAFAVQERVRADVERLPGVSHVALSNLFPFSRTNWEMLFRERSRWPAEDAESVLYTAATPGYFDVFSIELLAGRLIGEQDRADTEPVVVIDATAAERYWPGQDPLGRQVAVDDVREGDEFVPLWRTVVGVVGHVRNYELTEPSRIEAYVPLTQSPACCSTLWLTVRVTGDPAAAAPTVRALVRDTDPQIAVYRTNTMQAVIDRETALHRAVRSLFVVFGALALLLGAVGIYGVVASAASRRRREVGVRIALGSAPYHAAGKVALEGLRWVAAGLLVGLVGAAMAGRALESLLVGVSPAEPSVMLAASALLAAAALLATWLPSRRAARVEPGAVLREE